MSAGRIMAAVGPASVAVLGGSATAASIATVVVATGGAVALGLVGYGVYRYLSGGGSPANLPSAPRVTEVPPPPKRRSLE